MSLRALRMECSRPVDLEKRADEHACVGKLGWDNTMLKLILRAMELEGIGIWN